MFSQTLSGLKTINSNYIYNSQDFYNYGNVYISGSLISPFTDLLGISSINNSININNNYNHFTNEFFDLNDNLAISFSNHSNQINNLDVSTNLLDITQNNINADLQNSKNLISVSCSDLRTNDLLLQNEINAIVLAISYSGSVDALYGISMAVIDSYNRIYINNSGITLNTLNISSANLDIDTANLF